MRTVSAVAISSIVIALSAVAGRLLLPDLSSLGRTSPLATPTACDTTYETIVGRYYRDDHQQFLDFRDDGTVFMSVGGGGATYAVDGPSVVINTAVAGAARGSIPWNGTESVGTRCEYRGVIYQRIFFDKGNSTLQQALAGGWDKVAPRQ